MDSALLSLLGAFLLSLIGLFAFIWTSRQGLLVENPRAASVIFAPGEIGQIDDPALPAGEQGAMQAAVAPRGDPVVPADLTEHADRIAADRSTAFPVFVFLAFACMWLLVGSVAGLVASMSAGILAAWLLSLGACSVGHCLHRMVCGSDRAHGVARSVSEMNMHDSCIARNLWRLLILAAATGAASTLAAGQTRAAASEARYQRDTAVCLSKRYSGDRNECMSDASTARASREPVTIDPDPGRYARNAQKRCEALKEPDRGDCVARMQGQGTTSGSVAGGGIYRELVTREVGVPAAAASQSAAPPAAPASAPAQ